ncbi:tetratricopeptide repeat protein [Botrimarina hoheduenensis]|uniref:Lipoprotein NlpI n=1 Tax=Botrimarina hoheduenensis TaxID=2528000 RepID=A0A5C5WD71_9BACT|nr:tetratricopeptide repeat protein [Botrimarina hoheduenensis]TWT47612.1 lipoprotein NlpI [Botrimarina hoheduenensis]
MDATRWIATAVLLIGSAVHAQPEPTLAPPEPEPRADDIADRLGGALPAALPAWTVQPARRSETPAPFTLREPAPLTVADTATPLTLPEDDIAALLAGPREVTLAAHDSATAPLSGETLATETDHQPLTIEQLERAASGEPTPYRLNRLLTLADQAENGMHDADERRRLDRLRAWARHSRGQLLAKQGDAPGALADFRAALSLDPAATEVRHSLAVSLAEAQRLTEALAEFNQVLTSQPEWIEARRNRAAAYVRNGNLAAALADCNAAVAAGPPLGDARDFQTVGALRLRAEVYQRLDRPEDALADLNDLLGARPDDAEALDRRAALYAERGEYRLATRDYFAALEADPQRADAYRGLAWLLACHPDRTHRNPRMASESAQRARQLLGDTVETLEAAAVAAAAEQRYTDATRLQVLAINTAARSRTATSPGASERLAAFQRGSNWQLPRGVSVLMDRQVTPAGYEVEK